LPVAPKTARRDLDILVIEFIDSGVYEDVSDYM
jgi:hypothetical protein